MNIYHFCFYTHLRSLRSALYIKIKVFQIPPSSSTMHISGTFLARPAKPLTAKKTNSQHTFLSIFINSPSLVQILDNRHLERFGILAFCPNKVYLLVHLVSWDRMVIKSLQNILYRETVWARLLAVVKELLFKQRPHIR